jgi:hypothetical protein
MKEVNMQKVHVGSSTTHGALGVFPVWGEVDIVRDYSTAVAAAHVNEKATPDVKTLMVANTADRPLLLLEGQLLEGGWQNRMVARSVVVAPNDELAVGVVCVEAGRWSGQRRYADWRRRAAVRVQASLRASGDRQNEVWKRVSEYETRYGPNATSSFTEHVNRAADDVTPLVRGLRPFPGQIGIVIAISGYPLSAELFDSPLTLAEQYQSIVAAAAMDAVGRPAEVTPSRRVRRFIDRAINVQLRRNASAGAGITFVGNTEDASISLLRWQGRDVHTSLLNPRHELVGAA